MRFLVLFLLPLTAFATTTPVPAPVTQEQAQHQEQGQSQTQHQTNGQTNAGNSLSSGDYLALPGSASAYAPTIVNRTNCYFTPKTEGWAFWFISHSKAKTVRDEECRLHQVAEDIHPLSPALALKLHCRDPIIQELIKAGELDASLCVYTPPDRSRSQELSPVVKDYVDKQVESAKQRTDTAFRQSQSK